MAAPDHKGNRKRKDTENTHPTERDNIHGMRPELNADLILTQIDYLFLMRDRLQTMMQGTTAIETAIEQGDLSAVQQAIASGVEIKTEALALAAELGHIDIVEALIAAGVDVNQGDSDGWTPLMAAAGGGHTAIVEKLLAAGANVNAQTTFGLTPLMAAAAKGQAATVKQLIAAGADLNAKDQNSWTALVWALDGKHSEVVAVIKAARAQSLAP